MDNQQQHDALLHKYYSTQDQRTADAWRAFFEEEDFETGIATLGQVHETR